MIRRQAAYEAGLRNAGIDLDPRWMRELEWQRSYEVDSFFRSSGRETMRLWFQQDWRELGCTAILAQNDETAIGMIEAFREAGVEVPSQVSVVGFDGTEVSTFVRPRLTTIEVPLKQIGITAVRKLLVNPSTPSARASPPSLRSSPNSPPTSSSANRRRSRPAKTYAAENSIPFEARSIEPLIPVERNINSIQYRAEVDLRK